VHFGECANIEPAQQSPGKTEPPHHVRAPPIAASMSPPSRNRASAKRLRRSHRDFRADCIWRCGQPQNTGLL